MPSFISKCCITTLFFYKEYKNPQIERLASGSEDEKGTILIWDTK